MKTSNIFCLLLISLSCVSKKEPNHSESSVTVVNLQPVSKDSAYTSDFNFIGDSVLHGLKDIVRFYIKKYQHSDCPPLLYSKKNLKDALEIPVTLGAINKGVETSVFVLLPFTDCGDSDSLSDFGKCYYFTDTTLPKLKVDVYCTHPSNIFLVGDIDEDGISEIGEYYSSCSSHYKSLHVWSLKNGKWQQIGASTFDQHYMFYDKPFSSYIKKLGKGKFAMYEKTDLPMDSTKYGIGYWLKFKM